MSKRSSITKAIVAKLNLLLDGTAPYQTNLYGNAYAKLKFWDEIQDWPSVYATPGTEQREYLPGNFKWGHLGIALKVYCKGEDSQEQLETLLADIEACIDANRVLVYDQDKQHETTEILIQSIITDEGLLAPYAVGEVQLQVRYAIM